MSKNIATPTKPEKTEAKRKCAEVRVEGFDTETQELIVRINVNGLKFDELPLSSSGKTRKFTNGAMEAIGTFSGDAFPEAINGHNLRLQVGLYGDV